MSKAADRAARAAYLDGRIVDALAASRKPMTARDLKRRAFAGDESLSTFTIAHRLAALMKSRKLMRETVAGAGGLTVYAYSIPPEMKS